MFDDLENDSNRMGQDDGFDLLQDLEQNTSEEIRRQRIHFRVAVKVDVTLQSGNASELFDFKVQGVTGDISQGGLQALFPIPIQVGDVYRLQFNRSQLDLPLTFARCIRCRFVREGAYEGGFQFFATVALPEKIMVGQGA